MKYTEVEVTMETVSNEQIKGAANISSLQTLSVLSSSLDGTYLFLFES